MGLSLHSPIFSNGGAIPDRYSRLGRNLSPPLRWTDAPAATKSFIMVMEDADAPPGAFWHWTLYDINAQQSELREGAGAESPTHAQAVNDFGRACYDGPQPSADEGVHHYRFRLAALDVPHLELPPDARADDAWNAAQPHVIEEAELVGAFQR